MKKTSIWSLRSFAIPKGYRGRNVFVVLLWDLCNSTLFSNTPKPLYFLRNWILRVFGAKIGRGVRIRSSARICYPWKLEIGDASWIGDFVDIYNLEPIQIGRDSVISQYTKLITGSHDYKSEDFRYRNLPISIGSNVWLAIDCLVLPGSDIPDNTFYGPRSLIERRRDTVE